MCMIKCQDFRKISKIWSIKHCVRILGCIDIIPMKVQNSLLSISMIGRLNLVFYMAMVSTSSKSITVQISCLPHRGTKHLQYLWEMALFPLLCRIVSYSLETHQFGYGYKGIKREADAEGFIHWIWVFISCLLLYGNNLIMGWCSLVPFCCIKLSKIVNF